MKDYDQEEHETMFDYSLLDYMNNYVQEEGWYPSQDPLPEDYEFDYEDFYPGILDIDKDVGC